ncbi:electron transfer flavoprotein subunit alpha/FixB family protein [Azovibrio restrictus]|uniref:electron transfer flavoprotein subunit alpha/FixB family protein n=1 Tax=Azovibrio restrictus TaxID=146938 RepID=UPI0026EE1BB8|nr:FAD-binding protein [Azovibrio restrictus]
MTLLVLADHDGQRLDPASRSVLSAARQIGGDIHLLVAGSGVEAVAREGAACAGVSQVLWADAPHLRDREAANLAAQVLALAPAYTHILAPASSCGRDCMPRVAAQLDVEQISGIVAVHGPDTFTRPIYAGNVLATVQSRDPVKVITVRCPAFPPVGEGGAAPVEAIPAVPDLGLSRVLERRLDDSGRPDLGRARVVVSGGRGLGSRENFQALLQPLAQRLGAALGATRAAVDAGYAPNDWQVGQTGRIVAPELYLAIGLSGAIQHLAGMSDARVIVAINKDPEAPIFQVADYGLVADLNQALPELLAALG